MSKFIDLTGKKFGRLIVKRKFSINEKSHSFEWECLCDCGNYSKVTGNHLSSGHTKSCGKCTKDGIVNYWSEKDICFGEFSISKKVFFIDKEDYDKIKSLKLGIKRGKKTDYVISIHQFYSTGIHRIIMNAKTGEKVDHRDKNGLNNLRENLRFCTKQENSFNHTLSTANTSGISGVNWDTQRIKWIAHIVVSGKNIYLLRTKNKRDAIIARLQAEKKYFRDFAPQKHLFKEYGIE